MTLLPAPAHAGHWVWTVSGSGTASTNTAHSQTWTAPTGPVTSPISIPQIVAGDGAGRQFGGGTFPPIKANASMSVTITGTWTSDTNSDNTAPPSVLFSVQSSANGSYENNGSPAQAGQADDGLHDPFDPNAQMPGTSDTPTTEYKPSQSGSISVTLSLSGSGSGTPGLQGGGSAGTWVGPVTIAIHPQPYNFHQTDVTDNQNGTLTFTYFWSSTDGQLGDLDPSCLIHEYVTYQGGNPYVPPAPFSVQGGGLPNPTITPSPKRTGSLGYIVDNQLLAGVVQPHTSQSFVGTQTWEYDDSATGKTNQPIPGPDSGPLSITRAVGSRIPYVGTWYSVTKNSSTAWLQLSSQ